jgi:glycerophosphoryl diester phosphodiesterase
MWRLFLLLPLVLSCNQRITNMHSPSSAFDKQGHRGCRGLMPENTIAAMTKALDLNVTTLEMDVVITADNEVILSHEPFFNHEISAGPDGSQIPEQDERNHNIFRMSYADVRRYDVGLKPHPRFPEQQKLAAIKPRLADVIDSAESYARNSNRAQPFYNIETKCLPETDDIFHPPPQKFVELLMQIIEDKKIGERVIIQSFDFRTLQIVRKQFKGIRIAALVDEGDTRTMDVQLSILGFVPEVYSPHYSHVNTELVKLCKQKKMQLVPWTVNDAATMSKLKDMGVDGTITDYPDRFPY